MLIAYIMICRKYLDVGHTPRVVGGDRFMTFWGNLKGNLKRLSLFLLTISYMPVARAILENFAGEYRPEALALTKYAAWQCSGPPNPHSS